MGVERQIKNMWSSTDDGSVMYCPQNWDLIYSRGTQSNEAGKLQLVVGASGGSCSDRVHACVPFWNSFDVDVIVCVRALVARPRVFMNVGSESVIVVSALDDSCGDAWCLNIVKK